MEDQVLWHDIQAVLYQTYSELVSAATRGLSTIDKKTKAYKVTYRKCLDVMDQV
ncbi:unnamed protein product [Penicillium roqueforti FM164]|uniref:Uncharacterized protein n=1 Tax=Penicillium roqueforti (strain FM164) TaxID=1365484 RepID=W6R9J7_PENRF|nr:unnamed protein product [Penicillium roqueforti FM164]